MANFKRGKTKKKSHDGDGFNKTKDRDACAAAKGKGVAKKKAKKPYGIRRETLYHGSFWKKLGLSNPLVVNHWYETEKARDAALADMERKLEAKQNSRTWLGSSEFYEKISR